jgi:hypothetical protein
LVDKQYTTENTNSFSENGAIFQNKNSPSPFKSKEKTCNDFLWQLGRNYLLNAQHYMHVMISGEK